MSFCHKFELTGLGKIKEITFGLDANQEAVIAFYNPQRVLRQFGYDQSLAIAGVGSTPWDELSKYYSVGKASTYWRGIGDRHDKGILLTPSSRLSSITKRMIEHWQGLMEEYQCFIASDAEILTKKYQCFIASDAEILTKKRAKNPNGRLKHFSVTLARFCKKHKLPFRARDENDTWIEFPTDTKYGDDKRKDPTPSIDDDDEQEADVVADTASTRAAKRVKGGSSSLAKKVPAKRPSKGKGASSVPSAKAKHVPTRKSPRAKKYLNQSLGTMEPC